MIYFDSAYIAKCYLPEPGHAEVTALASSGPPLVSSAFSRLEVSAVFHRKLREGAVTAAEYRELGRQFTDDIDAGIWRLFPITDALLAHAHSRYQSLPPSLFVRSADCLHLCSAAEAGLKEIHSNDRHLLAAAGHFGLRGVDVIPARR
jgi:predicted nucleic acid-binding protein